MSGFITDGVISELLGRGLSYKQWRLVLEGVPFDGCIGGRYYTEWQRIWQHNFGCKSFQYTSTSKQRIIEHEFRLFRSEIECMVLEGHSWKAIARRLRGDVWTGEGKEEREMRLKMQRLFGCDARSHMFKTRAKRWQSQGVQEAKLLAVRKAQTFSKHINDRQQLNATSTSSQDSVIPIQRPEILVIKDSGQSFRCSFSTSSALASQDGSHLEIPQRHWTSPREANLCQIMLNLSLGAQQTKQELRAIKEDLFEIRDRFRDHEKAITSLQETRPQNIGSGNLGHDHSGFSTEQDGHDDSNEVKYHSRRRGRIFPSPQKAVHLHNHSQSKIPIRTYQNNTSTSPIISKEPPALPRGNGARLLDAGKMAYPVNTAVLRHMRGRNPNRDSGYNSPGSIHSSSSTNTLHAGGTRLDSVSEGVEN